ncbi:MAG: bifunctional metallophosphatase/5'-nucleotidase [bacterium]|nr:bifunctional metallophosphatase/5'-nucleotidase [bacterium]
MKRLYKLITIVLLMLFITGCDCKKKKKNNDKPIYVINTTDVHCSIEPYVDSKDETKNRLGYTNIMAYKKELEKTGYVALVDSGDFIQGELVGAISNGKYIIDIMNKMNYDAVTLGNHEFDYGMDGLKQRIHEFNGDTLSCNIRYTGSGENKLNEVKPYVIKEYGNTKVGFVGITTPETLTSSNPKYFKENDEVVYSFNHETKEQYYTCIQNNINKCKKDGADYVILLSHTGTKDENHPYNTYDILENTTGYVAIMDGHAHNNLSWQTLEDKDKKKVYVCDNGYKLNMFSILKIEDGKITCETKSICDMVDQELNSFISEINKNVDELKNRVLTTIDMDLSINDSEGIRLVRNRETQIGNLVADAYRIESNADIAFINGGGIRYDLHKGDVTYGDIMSVHPFGNSIMVKKVKGSQILDYLEFASRDTQSIYYDGTKKVGENGAFANVSGLKYSIDTNITSTVELDASGNFVKVAGERRVKDVLVLDGENYVAIEENKDYIVASIDYILNDGGDGANMFMNSITIPSVQELDYEVVINYIVNELHGQLATKYSTTEGRITILS